MQKISPFLWFNDNAEEAIKFYTSIFKDSKLVSTIPGPNGKVMGATFLLNGQQFMALNGGPQFKFTEAISLFVDCEGQEEVDEYWYKLLEGGGQKSMCGWLKDKYGLSWQIIPKQLGQMLSDKDPKKANAVMNAMLKMDKIDVETLKLAYANA
jgi:predicted 3-demethylubiquinone-9 3-methyltransferase (glyoxalase superfamily)